MPHAHVHAHVLTYLDLMSIGHWTYNEPTAQPHTMTENAVVLNPHYFSLSHCGRAGKCACFSFRVPAVSLALARRLDLGRGPSRSWPGGQAPRPFMNSRRTETERPRHLFVERSRCSDTGSAELCSRHISYRPNGWLRERRSPDPELRPFSTPPSQERKGHGHEQKGIERR